MQMDSINDSCIESAFNSSDYQLIEKIGEGGFGQVYKALQRRTQKMVAIKFLTLSPNIEPDKKRRHIERFHRESDLIRRLSHPNIVNLIDKGQQNDSLIYAVYEFVDGSTLKDHLDKHGAFSPTAAAEIMACVLDALAHAHEQGVIHRDIKPANIMLYEVGAKTHVKVLDFGIGTLKNEARQLDYKSITLTQETLGTPTYSAPEQLRGEPPVAQTDIYVWGLVFLECLTGVPTITGRSLAAVFHQQLSPTNVPLGMLAGHSSAHFLRRVLNKKSQQRPANTAELYHEFQKLNFTNLTGDLSSNQKRNPVKELGDTMQVNQHDATLVNDGHFSYSRLTERKQISVLCVILSTELLPCEGQATALIEQDVVDTFHSDQMQQCIDIAIRYGATHVGSLGDTLLFYFGYPKVSDNDSRLCSRAALEIVSNFNKKNALLKNSHGIISHIQMGMHAGLMQSLAGNEPEGKIAHDAMDLCRRAKTGQILCSDNVKLVLENHLIFQSLTPQENAQAGRSNQAKQLYLLRSERISEAFGFLRSTQKNRAFVGREQQLAQLLNVVMGSNESIQQKHKLAHIQGEAGIGKSRLVFELRERATKQQHFIAQCLPEHQNNALYPILNLLKVKYALDTLTDTQKITRLNEAIILTPLTQEHQAQALLVLAAWLNLATVEHADDNKKDNNVLANLAPTLQKQRLFDVLGHLLCQPQDKLNSQTKAHLFIFEDLHWADLTSEEFIKHFVQSDNFKTGRHSWLNTSRESLPELMSELPFTQITIDKLNETNSHDFINYLFEQQPLAKGLRALLIERSDGIPLFIEELVSTLKKQKLVHKVNGIIDFVDSEKQSLVPVTLREILQQRLDGLTSAKDTAQLAATIGRSFNYDLLVSASSKDEAQVQLDLDRLIKAELVYLQRQVEGDSYIFKHALVRDAAYESMDRKVREHSHGLIAEEIEKQGPLVVNSNLPGLAQHFAAATLHNKAKIYGIKAAKSFLERLLIDETISQCHKVLTWIKDSGDDQVEFDIEIEINRILTQALMSKNGWGHHDALHYINRSKKLFTQLQSDQYNENFVWALASSFSYYYVVGERNGMIELHRHLQTIITHKMSSGLKSVAYLMQAFIYYNDAKFTLAEKSLNDALSAFESDKHKNLMHLFGLDIYSWTKALLAIVYWNQGKIELANKIGIESINRAREIEHVPSLCLSLLYRSIIHQYNSDKNSANKTTEEVIRLSSQYGLPAYIGYATLINFWANDNQDTQQATHIVNSLKSIGCNTTLGFYESLVADVLVKNGELKQALKVLDNCLLSCEKHHEFAYEAELYRRKALYLISANDPKLHVEAQGSLEKALELSLNRGMQSTSQISKNKLQELLIIKNDLQLKKG